MRSAQAVLEGTSADIPFAKVVINLIEQIKTRDIIIARVLREEVRESAFKVAHIELLADSFMQVTEKVKSVLNDPSVDEAKKEQARTLLEAANHDFSLEKAKQEILDITLGLIAQTAQEAGENVSGVNFFVN
jgi:hypothetical protein